MRVLTRTIRGTLTLWYTLSVSVVSGIGTFLLYAIVVHTSYHNVDVLLQEEVEALGNAVIIQPVPDVQRYIAEMIEEDDRFSGQYKFIVVRERDGAVVAQSSNLAGRSLPFSERLLPTNNLTFTTGTFGAALPIRLATQQVVSPRGRTFIVQEAVSLEVVLAAHRRLRLTLLLLLPVLFALSLGSGWLIAGRALRPIETINHAVRTIEAHDLARRLPIGNPQDEIGQLTNILNSLLARLEGAFTTLRQFTANAAHELRTPLTVLRCGLDVVANKARTVEEYQEAIGTYTEQVVHLSHIVDDLFTLAQADAGKHELHWEIINLGALTQGLAEHIEIMAEAKELAIAHRVEAEVVIQGDRLWLTQLVLNVVENAVKYTPAGGRVQLTVARDADRAVLTVQDTGIGIPAEALPHIFDRFYRVSNDHSGASTGGGLGLSICQWIVHTHRGTIAVQSDYGKGSTFTVSFPLLSPI